MCDGRGNMASNLTAHPGIVGFFSAFLLLGVPPALAQDSQRALNAITDTAEKLCGNVVASGQYNYMTVKGDVKAELSGLVKRLADLGISGTGDVTSSSYEGILQE